MGPATASLPWGDATLAGAATRPDRLGPRGAPDGVALGLLGWSAKWEWTAEFGPYPGFQRVPIPRVLGGLLRTGISRPPRRVMGNQRAGRQQPLPQLGPAAAAPDLRGVQMRGVIDTHLTEGALDSLAADVHHGMGLPLKEIPPKYFYDARGSELFERDHQAARLLPDALRAAAPEPVRPRDRRADRGGRAGRARLGHGLQDARAPVRDGGPRQPPLLRAVRLLGDGRAATASSCSPICFPVSRCTAWSATSSRTSRRFRPAASD